MVTTRRSLVVLLVVGWLLATALPVAAASGSGRFTDDDGSPFEASIEAIAAAGITSGCGGTRFCPKDPVSRGQMAAFLTRALKLTKTSSIRFSDVPSGHPFAKEINRLATAGITSGCGGKRYCPGDLVSRGQMAAFLTRALKLTKTSSIRFSDVPSSHPFAREINRLATAKITSGCGGKRFCPKDPVSRGQMAAFLTRALDLPTKPTPPVSPPPDLPSPGNPTGNEPVPTEARAVDTSSPDRVIGTGTPASCTSAAVVAAVAKGGVITFDCGPNPVTIPMSATAKVFNDKPNVVLDGGGLVTLDGGGARRILYMNTCDQSLVWTTSHCQDQDHPTLTVQNLTFMNGRSSGTQTMDGGGAIFVRGGRFKVVNSGFYANRCAATGPDNGGAAIQVFSQHQGRPVYVVGSTFGGAGTLRNECSNGGAISSIGVSWTILNSLFQGNRAIGTGANPPKAGTPGGGNGGAIYNDGNAMTLRLDGTRIEDNRSNGEGGSAIFFVSNDRTGVVEVEDSVISGNTGDGFSTHPSIFFLGARITFTNSTVE